MKVKDLCKKIGGMTKCHISVFEGGKNIGVIYIEVFRHITKYEMSAYSFLERTVTFFNIIPSDKQLIVAVNVEPKEERA